MSVVFVFLRTHPVVTWRPNKFLTRQSFVIQTANEANSTMLMHDCVTVYLSFED